jgi:4-amino-4-deoxy-L-arabinose transferase-like glycosyltransferase
MPKWNWIMNKRSVKFSVSIFALAFGARLVTLFVRWHAGLNIDYNPQLGTYDDFAGYYVNWLQSLSSGLLPYKDFFYQYPPLFLYSLFLPYYLGGPWAAAIGIILADTGSAVVISLIAVKLTDPRIALIAGIGYALNPFALLYEGYVLFSLEPMLLFVLLTILLLRENKLLWSAASLALAIMFMQEAIGLLPAYLIYLRRYDRKSIAKAAILFVGIIVVISLPFLILTPAQYFNSMTFRPGTDTSLPTLAASVATASTSAPTTSCSFTQDLTRLVESCSYDGTTTVITAAIPASYQAATIFGDIFVIALLPMAVLVLPALYSIRKKNTFLEMSAAYSIAICLTVVALSASYVPLQDFNRYAFLPVYAILLVGGVSRKATLTALGFAGISLVLPPGAIQLVLPFLAIMIVMVVDDLRVSSNRSTVTLGTSPAAIEPGSIQICHPR